MRKVSFKLSKRGTRYPPNPKPNPSLVYVENGVDATSTVKHRQIPRVQHDVDYTKKRSVCIQTNHFLVNVLIVLIILIFKCDGFL